MDGAAATTKDDASGRVGWRGNRVAKRDDVVYLFPPICVSVTCLIPETRRDETRRVRRRRGQRS
jgi:hypothetical protein